MRSLALKSIVVTAALAATSAFGAETGLPFEQTQFDRTLPNVSQRAVEQSDVRVASAQQASGERATDASQASGGASAVSGAFTFATGVWANDHNFIAPAQ